MKKIFSIFNIIIIFLAIISILSTNTFALLNTNDFKPEEPNPTEYSSTVEKFTTLINIFLVVGVVVAIVGLSLLGIRYMLGSANEKAEYKETFLTFAFGAGFTCSIFAILRLIASVFN